MFYKILGTEWFTYNFWHPSENACVPVTYVILWEVKRAALCWTMTCLAYEEDITFPQCNQQPWRLQSHT